MVKRIFTILLFLFHRSPFIKLHIFSGIELSKVDVFKNGQKVNKSDKVNIDISDDVISLRVEAISSNDEAVYTIRVQGFEKDHGEVGLTVIEVAKTEGKER